ncbi:MAG: hypothetical protein AAFN78_18365, partial [Pseudomonadota bacterium]
MKQRTVYLLAGIVAALVVVCAVLFNPGFQRSQLLKRASPAVDLLEIGRVHITPWSTELDDVTVHYQGGTFEVDSGRLRYGLLSLLWKKLTVREVLLQGVRADLTGFEPPEATTEPPPEEEPAGPFPGALASLDFGYGYVLDEVAVDADVQLPDGQSVAATVT